MEPSLHRSHEVVFELSRSAAFHDHDHGGDAAAALLKLPGVVEAHVDKHGTWAMVTFDPMVAAVAALTGSLAAHGLMASRMRPLMEDSPATREPDTEDPGEG